MAIGRMPWYALLDVTHPSRATTATSMNAFVLAMSLCWRPRGSMFGGTFASVQNTKSRMSQSHHVFGDYILKTS